jgi:hypothetical protein
MANHLLGCQFDMSGVGCLASLVGVDGCQLGREVQRGQSGSEEARCMLHRNWLSKKAGVGWLGFSGSLMPTTRCRHPGRSCDCNHP